MLEYTEVAERKGEDCFVVRVGEPEADYDV